MKIISWNVNGIRACIKKDFIAFLEEAHADVICLQETKVLPEQASDEILYDYKQYTNSSDQKNYSGTMILFQDDVVSCTNGIGVQEYDNEGRVITADFEKFYLVNVYTPASHRGVDGLEYRLKWDSDFKNYILSLEQKKPVIICGDLSVAHNEIDIKHPRSNQKSPGFTDQERESFSQLLNAGYIDSYRYLHPDTKNAYTWWSYMYKAKETNGGWRMDYFLVSEKLKDAIVDVTLHSDIEGSDHCPISIELNL